MIKRVDFGFGKEGGCNGALQGDVGALVVALQIESKVRAPCQLLNRRIDTSRSSWQLDELGAEAHFRQVTAEVNLIVLEAALTQLMYKLKSKQLRTEATIAFSTSDQRSRRWEGRQ